MAETPPADPLRPSPADASNSTVPQSAVPQSAVPTDDGVPPTSGADPAVGSLTSESREEFLLREEAAVGESELARGVNDGLRALARAARSFLLYDPGNEAIRVFLEAYRTDMMGAVKGIIDTGKYGDTVELLIRPFELVWDGEVVYLERDRERSLAFRMFRDGVRRLTLQADVSWDELLRLLQILSVRFTGVHQQEEDIVTLLWKAGFKHIEIVAVEGFVPEDDELDDDDDDGLPDHVAGQGEETGRRRRTRNQRSSEAHTAASYVDAPVDFDQPMVAILEPGRVLPAPVSDADLLALQHEATSRTLPKQCVRLAKEMLALVADPQDPTDWPDVRHLIDEVRDFLLAEGQMQALIDLVTSMEDLRAVDPKQVDAVLRGFVDVRALRRIVRSVPASHTRPPDDLLWLLDHLPGDHLDHTLDILTLERAAGPRRILRQLVERFIEGAPDLVLERIQTGDPSVAADLLRAFCEAVPDRSLDGIAAAVGRGDVDLSFEALRVLDRVDASADVLNLLLILLDSDLEEVRLRSLEQISGRKARSLFSQIQAALVKSARQRMSPKEASAFGTTLVALDQARACALLSEWIKPKSVFKRFFQDPIGLKWLQWAAVSGMGQVPGDHTETIIRWLAERAGSDLADHCARTLARRRLEQSHA